MDFFFICGKKKSKRAAMNLLFLESILLSLWFDLPKIDIELRKDIELKIDIEVLTK